MLCKCGYPRPYSWLGGTHCDGGGGSSDWYEEQNFQRIVAILRARELPLERVVTGRTLNQGN